MRRNPGEFPDSDYDVISPGTPGGIKGRISQLVNLKTFNSLRIPAFRFFWAALLCQMTAMNMQMMARSLLIYRLTGSTAILGIMSLFNAIPMLLLSLFGGVLADRLPKKTVMIFGQSGSAVISLGIALSLQMGYLSADREGSWWILAVAALFQGTVMGLMMPSRQAMIPEIVGEEQLLNAISLSNMGTSVMRFIAPAATGFLIDAFDFQAVYFGMTVMYLLAVVFLSFLRVKGGVRVRASGALADIKEGIGYLRRQTIILFILAFSLLAVLLSMPYAMLLPVFTDDILMNSAGQPVGATGLGLLMSISGIGAITVSLVLASLPNKKRGLMLIVGTLIMALALVAFAFSTSMTLSLVIIAFVGLGQASRMALANTLIQYYSDPEYRGRVMSIYMMQFGLTSFSAAIAGVIAETVDIQWVIGGFAMTLIVISMAALVFAGRLRRLD
jgi:MFS family permease